MAEEESEVAGPPLGEARRRTFHHHFYTQQRNVAEGAPLAHNSTAAGHCVEGEGGGGEEGGGAGGKQCRQHPEPVHRQPVRETLRPAVVRKVGLWPELLRPREASDASDPRQPVPTTLWGTNEAQEAIWKHQNPPVETCRNQSYFIARTVRRGPR